MCITIPFWLDVLQLDRPVFVLVLRRPHDVATSLVNGGVPPAHAFAMWERYTLSALQHLCGHRVAVVHYESLLQEASATARSLGEVLQAAGAGVSAGAAETAATAVRPPKQLRTRPNVTPPEMNGQHHALWNIMQRLPAWSETFAIDVPEESATTRELLRAVAGVAWWESQVGTFHDRLGALLGRSGPQDLIH